jgi:hypothetical protein
MGHLRDPSDGKHYAEVLQKRREIDSFNPRSLH